MSEYLLLENAKGEGPEKVYNYVSTLLNEIKRLELEINDKNRQAPIRINTSVFLEETARTLYYNKIPLSDRNNPEKMKKYWELYELEKEKLANKIFNNIKK